MGFGFEIKLDLNKISEPTLHLLRLQEGIFTAVTFINKKQSFMSFFCNCCIVKLTLHHQNHYDETLKKKTLSCNNKQFPQHFSTYREFDCFCEKIVFFCDILSRFGFAMPCHVFVLL